MKRTYFSYTQKDFRVMFFGNKGCLVNTFYLLVGQAYVKASCEEVSLAIMHADMVQGYVTADTEKRKAVNALMVYISFIHL